MREHIKRIIISEKEIAERIEQLGKEITETYKGYDSLVVIAIINGAIVFVSDLIQKIDIPMKFDCMRVSSYLNGTSPSQRPEIIDVLRLTLDNEHVLIVDDIFDTGNTYAQVMKEIRKRKPTSVKFATLLEKKKRREVGASPDFIGFSIPDEFVVGYGLDFAEKYRNLPYIGILKPEYQRVL